jgi:hypothetical protein
LSGLGDKAEVIWAQASKLMSLDGFLPGAVRTGWRVLGEDWTTGIMAVVLLMLSGGAWLSWRWRLISIEQEGESRPRTGGAESARMGMAALAGAAIFVCAWLPAVVIREQWAAPRLCYVPTMGGVIALGAVLEWVARSLAGKRVVQRAVLMVMGTAALPICVAGALALVGVQWSLQKRYRMDQEQLAILKALVPAPAPETVFMPVRLEDWPTGVRTGSPVFDTFARGIWEIPWSAAYGVMQTYGTRRVYALPINRWAALPLDQITGESFVYSGARFWSAHPKLPDGRHIVPWSHVAPFAVDSEHRLRLVQRLIFTRGGVEVARAEMPVVKHARERAGGRGSFLDEIVVELGGPRGR